MIRAIFFDFDGTLADTAPGIVATMTETFNRLSVPVPSEADMRATIGMLLIDALRQLGNLDDAMTQKAFETYQSLFRTIELTRTTLFPGVVETVKALHDKGLRLAIATSRGLESLEMVLGKYGILQYFETKATKNDRLTPKPAPDMVLELLRRMDLEPDEAIVVGDTTFDIDMGNSANCRTIAVTYGNHPKSRLQASHPTYMIDSIGEILGLV